MNFDKKNVIIAVLVVVLLASFFLNMFFPPSTVMAISAEEAGQKALAFINSNMLVSGDAILNNVVDDGDKYKLELSVQGEKYVSYITKDGKMLFPQGIEIEKVPEPTAFDAPDSAKPEVDLYVMSYCPFGTQAEGIMKPVYDLLKDKMDFNVRFIAHVINGTVNSLHGPVEADEDMRQLCIIKNYGMDVWWDYVTDVNSKCTYDDIVTCWKTMADDNEIDVETIETCYDDEGVALIEADEQKVNENAVSSSPTLIINGQEYSGARTPEAYKQGICSGFTTPPAECSETLSTTQQAADGGC